MKAFAVRLLSVLVRAGLVWLPGLAHAGLASNALDSFSPAPGWVGPTRPGLGTPCTHNRKEIVMKGFAARLQRVLTLAITAGLVWLPAVAHAGIVLNAID